MRRLTFLLPFGLFHASLAMAQSALQSPEQFLGYPLGERYTEHHRITSYFQHVAQSLPSRVRLQRYGQTNEARPLMLAFVTSPRNLQRLEDIRKNNLRMAGVLNDGTNAVDTLPVILWLSYNVHGNEPSSSEAAMMTVHRLVDGSDPRTADWMEKAVIVIDPCINPDGRDRYANWFNGIAGSAADLSPSSREHREPWPGGRTNHYYFDLNRDWAWQSQLETRQRMRAYNDWLPQLHVDFHEQSPNEPYYFAPAAEPYHEAVTPWQREFQRIIGRNNAAQFDRMGRLYFTRQRFDLLYPSYGDTYPTYSGAIGMTYEQGGGARAGRAIVVEDGDTLTLRHRLENHFTTGMATLETCVGHAARLRTEFARFYAEASKEQPGAVRLYVVKRSATGEGAALHGYLTRNGIAYGYAQTKMPAKGFSYRTGAESALTVEAGDLLIPAAQPRGTLLRVLFEAETRVTDSATYDITAWSLPYALGLDAYALRERPAGLSLPEPPALPPAAPALPADTAAYAYVVPWNGFPSARLLAALLRAGIVARYAERPFTAGGRDFSAGSLVITRTANRKKGAELHAAIRGAMESVQGLNGEVAALATGLVEKGYDLGSGQVRAIKPPRVAMVVGEGTAANAVGEIWHLFDKELRYPLSLLPAQDLQAFDGGAFDVLILPDGNHRFLADKSQAQALAEWVRKGGRLIALENAVAQIAGLDWGLRAKKDSAGRAREETAQRRYADRERDAFARSIPGAVYKVELDNTHPLAFGYPGWYHTLKMDDRLYEFLGNGGWNVGVIRREAHVAGVAGTKVRERLREGMLFGVQEMGRGNIVYLADDPVFRGFWENGKLLLSNAVFMVGQ